jgi:very-short-patch-repair endonuclease
MAQSLIKTAKALRKRPIDVEMLLWRYLRAKQMEGLKFRRQQPIGRYIVNFACFEKKIVIEVDGGQHAVERRKDTERDEWLRRQGFNVLRFWNNEVLTNTQGVLEIIRISCLSHPPLNPLPSREGKREERLTSREGKREERLKLREGKREERLKLREGKREERFSSREGKEKDRLPPREGKEREGL